MNPKLRDVFGVRAASVLSYIVRPDVDERFLSGLKTDKQIIIYGASKQGKTSLVAKHLPEESNIKIHVTPKTEIVDIYASILRQLGIKIVDQTSTSSNQEFGVTFGAKVKAFIPIFGGGEVKAEGQSKAGSGETILYEEVNFNLSLPQDISELLHRSAKGKAIILENFHYLDDSRQKQFAFDLRIFQELGIRFVILGVWQEKNRLAQFNGDLLDRVIEVPVEPWKAYDFVRVAQEGARFLNIDFADYILKMAIDASFGSIGVFQELLRELCMNAGIAEAQPMVVRIENQHYIEKAIRKKTDDYASRHQRILETIAAGNSFGSNSQGGPSPLFLTYYLVKIILAGGYDSLCNGMHHSSVHKKIRLIHHRPDDVRASDISVLLHNLAVMQGSKGIVPPIFDYDRTMKHLQVVDSTFYFFLKNADLAQIAEEIPNPLHR